MKKHSSSKRAWLIASSNAVLALLVGSAPIALGEEPSPLPDAAAGSANGIAAANHLAPVVPGLRFESTSNGFSFCPPANCRRSGAISSKYIAEWVDGQRMWRLSLARMEPPKPRSLMNTKNNFGKEETGLVEEIVARLKSDLPGCKVLRQDVTNIAQGSAIDPAHPEAETPNVGVIAIRYTQAAQHYLSQQAVIEASDRLYYLLTLTTPGRKDDGSSQQADDPGERQAVEAFSAMIDSVNLLNRGEIKRDQDDRLYRTRTLLLNLTTARLHAALIKQQWLRYRKDGKDVGYAYITEETAAGIPRPMTREEVNAGKTELDLVRAGDGILIGIRTRTISDAKRGDKPISIQNDSATWFFTTPDRKHEDWTRYAVMDDHVSPEKSVIQEIGSSDKRVTTKLVRPPQPEKAAGGALGGFGQPAAEPWIDVRDIYELNVNLRNNHESPEPITRELPPWYIPQALGHLLPRLVPLHRPGKYLFATYVPEVGEVMMRYVDVKEEQNVDFAGQTVRAVPVEDRLGLDGSVTTHYMSPEGAYIGSENKEQKLMILPTDGETLMNIWKSANLTRPAGVQTAPGKTLPSQRSSVMPNSFGPAVPSR